MPTIKLTNAEIDELKRRGATVRGGNGLGHTKKWSNATPTTVRGIRFPSKVEARVYLRLVEEFTDQPIRRQVRMPLLAGLVDGKLLALRVDFAIVLPDKPILWVDAKTKRKSREWLRGKCLFELTWGRIHEWDGIGDPPWK